MNIHDFEKQQEALGLKRSVSVEGFAAPIKELDKITNDKVKQMINMSDSAKVHDSIVTESI